jgi:hypothetical protein
MVCRLCGRGPARNVFLMRNIGMVIAFRAIRFKGPLCKEHAAQMANDFLSKTLVQGWWGIISFFVNFVAVVVDLRAAGMAKKMLEPVAPAATQMPPPPGAPSFTSGS